MKNNNLLIKHIVDGILEKKGQEIIDLDLTKIQNAFCDHFIICHAESNTQVSAIADSIEKKVREELNENVNHREGLKNAMWILLDYNGIIVHIFQREYREFYRLEELWGDAKLIRVEESFI